MISKRYKSAKRLLIFTLLGFVLGHVLARVKDWLDQARLVSQFDQVGLATFIQLLLLVLSAVAILLAVSYFWRADEDRKIYDNLDDDDLGEELYRKMNLTYAYVNFLSGFGLVLAILALLLIAQHDQNLPGSQILLALLAILELLLATGLQMLYLKRHNQIRGVRSPLVPSLKEIKANVLKQDEAELAATYQMSFSILTDLTGLILPAIYLISFAVSVLTGRLELLTLLAAGSIHLYILLKQLQMAKTYYR